MRDDFASFVADRLTPAQRNLFRSTLEGMTGRMNGEDVIDFLAGELDGGPRLFIVTTHRLWWVEPNNPLAWSLPGSRIDRMEAMGGDSVEVRLFANPQWSDVPEVFQIGGVDHGRAHEFLLKVSMLSAGQLWGRPEAYWASVEELHRKAERLEHAEQRSSPKSAHAASNDMAAFIDQRLTPAQRHRFRDRLAGASGVINDEPVVDMLVGGFNGGDELLYILTTHNLRMAFPDESEWQRFPGERIQIVMVDSPDAIRVQLNPDTQRGIPAGSFRITGINQEHANRFMALTNLLSLGKLWGKPEEFMTKVVDLGQHAQSMPQPPKPSQPAKQGCLVTLLALVLPGASAMAYLLARRS